MPDEEQIEVDAGAIVVADVSLLKHNEWRQFINKWEGDHNGGLIPITVSGYTGALCIKSYGMEDDGSGTHVVTVKKDEHGVPQRLVVDLHCKEKRRAEQWRNRGEHKDARTLQPLIFALRRARVMATMVDLGPEARRYAQDIVRALEDVVGHRALTG